MKKIGPEVVKVKRYNIKNGSSLSIFPLNYVDSPPRPKRVETEQPEKVSFSNRVNEDLVADYKDIEAPPTDRLFDTFPYSREETKQSFSKYKRYGKRNNSRENTDASLCDPQFTKMNGSYMSEQSIPINDIHRTDTLDVPRKLNLNSNISKRISNSKGRNTKRLDGSDPYSNNDITVSSLIKRRGKDVNFPNILSIKESTDEIVADSVPDSPYFSTNIKVFKGNKHLADSANISENPLTLRSAFKKNFSNNPSNFETRVEMNIQDEVEKLGASLNQDQLLANFTHVNQKILTMSLKSNQSPSSNLQKLCLIQKFERDEFEAKDDVKNPYNSNLIPEEAARPRKNFKGRNSRFMHRAASKTPDCTITAFKLPEIADKNSTIQHDTKANSRKVSFGRYDNRSVEKNDRESVKSQKDSLKSLTSGKIVEDTLINLHNIKRPSTTMHINKNYKLNKKMRRYKEGRESFEKMPYGNKAAKANRDLIEKFSQTLQQYEAKLNPRVEDTMQDYR